MTAADVEVRFFTRVIDAEADVNDKRVKGVVIHNIEGYRFIAAKAFIDCTGDAVLANLCGADCWEAGRDTPRIMPATLPSLFAGIDWERVRRYWKEEGHEQGNGIIRKGIADGIFIQPDPFLVGMSQIGPTVGYLNGGHLFNLNALRSSELSRNVMLGRRIAQDYLAFYRKYIPGCEKLEHVTTASLIGVRESRRIKGEYVLTIDDYIARREFPDQIGIFNKFVDIHPYDTSEEEYQRFMKEKDQQLRMDVGESLRHSLRRSRAERLAESLGGGALRLERCPCAWLDPGATGLRDDGTGGRYGSRAIDPAPATRLRVGYRATKGDNLAER